MGYIIAVNGYLRVGLRIIARPQVHPNIDTVSRPKLSFYHSTSLRDVPPTLTLLFTRPQLLTLSLVHSFSSSYFHQFPNSINLLCKYALECDEDSEILILYIVTLEIRVLEHTNKMTSNHFQSSTTIA